MFVNDVCPMDANGYCQRHKSTHHEEVRKIVLRQDAFGAKVRAILDRQLTFRMGYPDFSPIRLSPEGDDSRCRHLGSEVIGYRACGSCKGSVRRKEFACAVGFGVDGRAAPVLDCGPKCQGYDPIGGASEVPLLVQETIDPSCRFVTKFDEHNLCIGVPHKRFNPSLMEWKDGYLLAFRHGWRGSDIFLVMLDQHFHPKGECVRLNLRHAESNYGREDPRLFMFRGQVHISFVGVVGGSRIRHTNVLYAKLTDDLKVQDVFFPRYHRRNLWEKNWSFFGHDNKLYAVYSFAPHRILHIDSEQCEDAYETQTSAPWNLGSEVRGGAAPVLIEDQFWSFFHSRFEREGKRIYVGGLYTFEAKPPFRVMGIIPDPILISRLDDKPGDQYAYVVWPSGAILRNRKWTISCGIHDRWTELYEFDHDELCERIIPIRPPSWWSDNGTENDASIYQWVVGRNEYGLPKRMDGRVIVDVGAHVGSFAHACRLRGAKEVHCYEPWPVSYENLTRNAHHMGGVIHHRVAVSGTKGTLYFRESPDQNNSGGFWYADKPPGDPVQSITLDDVLSSVDGSVDLLKLDCEGCEWSVLGSNPDLSKVKEVVGEYHPGGDLNWMYQFFLNNKFKMTHSPTEDGRGLFKAIREDRHG